MVGGYTERRSVTILHIRLTGLRPDRCPFCALFCALFINKKSNLKGHAQERNQGSKAPHSLFSEALFVRRGASPWHDYTATPWFQARLLACLLACLRVGLILCSLKEIGIGI